MLSVEKLKDNRNIKKQVSSDQYAGELRRWYCLAEDQRRSQSRLGLEAEESFPSKEGGMMQAWTWTEELEVEKKRPVGD